MIKEQKNKLSLLAVIIININIMLGSGIFINTSILTKLAGSLSSLIYPIVAILLLPLILSISSLLNHCAAEGTFYHFGKIISPYFGFLSSWAYFIAKLASAALSIHVCISFLQEIIPALKIFPTLAIDCLVTVLFACLNMLNMQAGKAINYSFIFCKFIPILWAIFVGAYLFSSANFTPESIIISGIPASVPLVLYAFVGFEASCSLSRSIDNPKDNGPKSIFISYLIVILLVTAYQFFFYSALGMQLGQLTQGYLSIFPALLTKLFNNSFSNIKAGILLILNLGIASSSLGSAYGIMYSNSWNLYTLAANDHTIAKKLLVYFNKYQVPICAVLIEALLIISFLIITQGHQVPLQQVAALGSTIAYTISSFALCVLTYRTAKRVHVLSLLSLISCSLLIIAVIWSAKISGVSNLLLLYLIILSLGSFMFYRKHKLSEDLSIFEKL